MTSHLISELMRQFLILTYNDQKFTTQTIPKTRNPVWNAVFDLTVTTFTPSDLLEGVCWDRDRFRKDYLGEFSQNLYDLFPKGAMSLEDPDNDVILSETMR